MKNIAVICDSSASLTHHMFKDVDVYVAPLTILHNNVDYYDQTTLSHEEVHELLRKKERIQTSQPNLGTLIELFSSIKKKEYDDVYCLSLSSHLSGTYAAFLQAQQEVSIQNFHLFDSLTLAGPIHQAIRTIETLNRLNYSTTAISQSLDDIFRNTEAFVYPQNLDQLKISGRISKTAGALASLLKVKPLLTLENSGTTIEKYATFRTESKVFDAICDRMIQKEITPESYDLYLLECDGVETLDRLDRQITLRLGDFKRYRIVLPAAIATHAGLGTIALQWVPKDDKYVK